MNDIGPTTDTLPVTPEVAPKSHWQAWALMLLVWAALLTIYREPVGLLLEAWESLPTHEHGYLVLAVVAWLAWTKRAAVRAAPISPSLKGLLALFLAGCLGFLGELAAVAVAVQISVILMFQAALWAVMGDRVFRALVGPLSFLFFGVPIGQEIVPILMDWTADATVYGLRASGVPVLQLDRHFVIPSGSWSVVEACSGIRYLITSAFVGSIFAYITYTKWQKRVLFIAWMIFLPLVANWLRAYTIVMAAHLTDNQWGLGMSHTAFGWIIFGVAIIVSFAIGNRWADRASVATAHGGAPATSAGMARTLAGAAAAVLVMAGWHQGAVTVEALPHRGTPLLDLSASLGDLKPVPPQTPSIAPRYSGAAALHQRTYQYKGAELGVTIAYYRNQRQGAELVHVGNELEPTREWEWRKSDKVELGSPALPRLRRDVYVKGRSTSIAYHFYWIGGFTTTSATASKALEILSRILGRGDDAAAVVVTASDAEDGMRAGPLVEAFLRERLPRALEDLARTPATSTDAQGLLQSGRPASP